MGQSPVSPWAVYEMPRPPSFKGFLIAKLGGEIAMSPEGQCGPLPCAGHWAEPGARAGGESLQGALFRGAGRSCPASGRGGCGQSQVRQRGNGIIVWTHLPFLPQSWANVLRLRRQLEQPACLHTHGRGARRGRARASGPCPPITRRPCPGILGATPAAWGSRALVGPKFPWPHATALGPDQ